MKVGVMNTNTVNKAFTFVEKINKQDLKTLIKLMDKNYQ